MLGSSWVAKQLLTSQEGLDSMELGRYAVTVPFLSRLMHIADVISSSDVPHTPTDLCFDINA
jgi:hypothetical protein